MAENRSNESRSIGRRIIRGVLVILLGCVGTCALCYFAWNFNYISADFAAWRAKGRVERIYAQTRKAAPKGITLIREEKPNSDIYHCALSDGAPQYASVRAQQIYRTTTPFSDVLAAYQAKFAAWGWVESNTTDLRIVGFRHPSDENLVVGLCAPVETFPSAGYTRFVIFFGFDETSGCEGTWTRLEWIAARYCN